MPETRTYRARWILPMVGEPIAGGFITVSPERILSVGPTTDDDYQDLGDVAIMPGLVNAHTHLEFSHLASPYGEPGILFPDWLRLVVADRANSNASPATTMADKQASLEMGWQELTNTGQVAAGEIATTAGLFPNSIHDTQRMVGFLEWIALREERREELESRLHDHTTEWISQGELRPAISPHSPYTLHPQLFETSILRAIEQDLPVALHLAESEPELELLATGQGSMRDFLESLGVFHARAFAQPRTAQWYLSRLSNASRALVVHGNYLNHSELEFIAQRRLQLTLVYCPRTHHFFEHADYPLRQAIKLGAQVALGTDSRASNPDLSLWEELRFVARKFPDIEPEALLRMVTRNAAYGLGLEQQLGTLEAGKLPTFAILAISPHLKDPYLAVVESESPPQLVRSF